MFIKVILPQALFIDLINTENFHLGGVVVMSPKRKYVLLSDMSCKQVATMGEGFCLSLVEFHQGKTFALDVHEQISFLEEEQRAKSKEQRDVA